MHHKSENGNSFMGTVMILMAVAVLSIYIIHLCQKAINESRADSILNGVLELAEHEKERMDATDNSSTLEDEHTIIGSIERKGYGFTLVEGSSPTLIKIETEKKTITHGVCSVLKKKLKKSMWRDLFQKVLIVDRMGDEKTDISIYDCPLERIPALRFYVKFEANLQQEIPQKEEVAPEVQLPSLPPAPKATSTPARTTTSKRVSLPSYTSKTSCPPGTSPDGRGASATAGCRCNHSGETWNGSSCGSSCPPGSSRSTNAEGDSTNVSGCHCNAETPVWSGTRCVSKCPGNKVFDPDKGACVCPSHMIPKSNNPQVCVECNISSDCSGEYKCVSNRCTNDDKEYEDCRWGICQTCEQDGFRSNITEPMTCEVAGLSGECNGNGTCYPLEGRRCSANRKCSSGEFCNYGGNFNSSKKQNGKFGHTPNVCQIVDPQEFVYKNVTYYYNSKKDLKSWCRAANNKPNCKWGYLAKPGAESWCASQGKRLLTQAEMAAVWDVLKKELPQTYTGYAYWIQEGVWLEDKLGRRSVGKAHADGYGGRGGVVCR